MQVEESNEKDTVDKHKRNNSIVAL